MNITIIDDQNHLAHFSLIHGMATGWYNHISASVHLVFNELLNDTIASVSTDGGFAIVYHENDAVIGFAIMTPRPLEYFTNTPAFRIEHYFNANDIEKYQLHGDEKLTALFEQSWYLDTLWVSPDYRKRGIAGKLLQQINALVEGKPVGLLVMFDENMPDDFNSLPAFYTKKGFKNALWLYPQYPNKKGISEHRLVLLMIAPQGITA